ncbi:MAG TPA: AMP-binding protein [Steroidobacteraceae bacterium]|nr:AMP-binding protein [Steroidobacteraceae bacterium]
MNARAGVRLSIAHGGPLAQEPGLGALTLPGYLREIADRFTDREALVLRRPQRIERWSYAELWARSMEVARALVALGVGKDTRVGILMANRPQWLSSFFGTMLAGGVAVGLSTFSTMNELDYLLKVSSVGVLLFESNVVKKDFVAMLGDLEPKIATTSAGPLGSTRFPFLRHLVVLESGRSGGAIESWDQFTARGRAVSPALIEATADSVRPSDAGAVFFSSGSTARPKGVLSAQRAISIQLWRFRRMYNVSGDVRTWTPNGFFWSGNFAMVLASTLSNGGSIVLQPTFVAREALELMEAERVNLPIAWPHQAKQLEEAPNWKDVDLSALRFVDPASPLAHHPSFVSASWEEPRRSYGSTETFTISASFPAGTPQDIGGDSTGEVLPGNTIKIVDPISGETLPLGERGEIAVKGPTLMLGYIGVPLDETLDEDGFYRSGDGGYLDERGRVYFEGRLTTVIKTGGANVSPLEIDATLESLPGVKAAATVGVPHETLGEMVVSCVVLAEGATLDGAAIQTFLKQRLASYKVPRRVLFLHEDEIALTGSAKIKSGELRKLAAQRLAGELPAA